MKTFNYIHIKLMENDTKWVVYNYKTYKIITVHNTYKEAEEIWGKIQLLRM